MKPLDLEKSTQETLLKILREYKIDAEIDADEDIRIDGSPAIFLKTTLKQDQIKFFGSLAVAQDDVSKEDGEHFAFVMNVIHKLMKFSYIENDIGNGIFFEASLLKRGFIDEGYLIEFYQELRKNVSTVQSLVPSIHEIRKVKEGSK
ncbi:hypothetical protein [Pantoea sp. Haah2121]|jgi:hypothetical protein|uniref:hypothetical protein n=1 Tax=Pantoea sp. Haah2121 TaxID=3109350 RepID=UPI002FFE1A5C